jgi:hypothetical protein
VVENLALRDYRRYYETTEGTEQYSVFSLKNSTRLTLMSL